MNNDSVPSVPFVDLDDWYKNLITDVEKIIKEDDSMLFSSIPKIFVPSFKNSIHSKEEVIGVIGGYYFQSAQGDKKIAEGYAAPILQINLNKLSKKFGVDFGEVILQVWGNSDDWGQGKPALVEVVNREDIIDRADNSCLNLELPKNLIDADEYEKATHCFDWSNSNYKHHLNLDDPYFITDLEFAGVNTQLFTLKQASLCEEKLSGNHKATAEIKELAELDHHFEELLSEGYIEALNYIQELFFATSFGNFDKESYIALLTEYDDGFDWEEYLHDEVIGINSWKPLITMYGPLSEPTEDYYSVYYRINDKSEVEYKAMARRWCY